MTPETLSVLISWTPFMAEGFGLNVLIGVLAALLGTAGSALLLYLSRVSPPALSRFIDFLVSMCRNVPTLIFMFYLATLVPRHVPLWGSAVLTIAPWVKATVALAITAIGYATWNLRDAIAAWHAGEHHKALMFVPNWLNSLLTGVLASTTASLVGVNELVSRSNVIIAATGGQQMIAVYLYASLYFLVFSVIATWMFAAIRLWLHRRYLGNGSPSPAR